jgi:hypothetical protein
MSRFRAFVDPILDLISSVGIYTYGAFGYLTSKLDYVTQVMIILMFTVYTVLKSREDQTVLSNYAYFLAGYFVGLEGGALLKV